MTSNSTISMICEGVRLSVRYNYVIFPFATSELLAELTRLNADYSLVPIPRGAKPPIGAKLDWSGQVARKDNVTIDFDSISQTIAAEGKNPSDTARIFTEIDEIIKSNLYLNLEERIRFYEVTLSYSIKTGKNPLKTLGKIKPEGKLYDSLEKILNEPISNYSLHFCKQTKSVESSDWFDLRIHPVAPKSMSVFEVLAVYRNKNRSKVVDFSTNIENIISQIFTELD